MALRAGPDGLWSEASAVPHPGWASSQGRAARPLSRFLPFSPQTFAFERKQERKRFALLGGTREARVGKQSQWRVSFSNWDFESPAKKNLLSRSAQRSVRTSAEKFIRRVSSGLGLLSISFTSRCRLGFGFFYSPFRHSTSGFRFPRRDPCFLCLRRSAFRGGSKRVWRRSVRSRLPALWRSRSTIPTIRARCLFPLRISPVISYSNNVRSFCRRFSVFSCGAKCGSRRQSASRKNELGPASVPSRGMPQLRGGGFENAWATRRPRALRPAPNSRLRTGTDQGNPTV